MVVIASPFIIVFGLLYQRTSGEPLGSSMFKAYSVLQDVPGASACDEDDGKSAWVLNLTHLVCPQHRSHPASVPWLVVVDSQAGTNSANIVPVDFGGWDHRMLTRLQVVKHVRFR